MSAIRLARGFTGRDVVVKFAGCYHGHVDALLASGGLRPGDPRRPGHARRPGLRGGRDDRAALQRPRRPSSAAFAEHGDRIACLITEATPGNMGVVPPEPGFNGFLAETCRGTARSSSATR